MRLPSVKSLNTRLPANLRALRSQETVRILSRRKLSERDVRTARETIGKVFKGIVARTGDRYLTLVRRTPKKPKLLKWKTAFRKTPEGWEVKLTAGSRYTLTVGGFASRHSVVMCGRRCKSALLCGENV